MRHCRLEIAVHAISGCEFSFNKHFTVPFRVKFFCGSAAAGRLSSKAQAVPPFRGARVLALRSVQLRLWTSFLSMTHSTLGASSSLLIRHAPLARALHVLDVLVKRAARRFV